MNQELKDRIESLRQSAGHCERIGLESMAKLFRRKAKYLKLFGDAPWRIRE